ncbi:MAG: leucine-rich repeat domain-containing protein, partial [Lachnospiraceae bacterium]|nr:leucine-rich repeat domain-containing protein [Lachnospiraceae bacterium]
MKKKRIAVLLVIAVLLIIGAGVYLYFKPIHMPTWMTYPYDVTVEKGNVRINMYLGEEEKIKIPSRILGAKVVKVDYKAFNDIGTRAVIEDVSEDIVYVERVFDYKSQCYYGLLDDSAWVTEYAGNEKRVEIPEAIWGREVDRIEDYAFYNCDIEEVLLPETVKYIEAHVFTKCKDLKQMVLPENL